MRRCSPATNGFAKFKRYPLVAPGTPVSTNLGADGRARESGPPKKVSISKLARVHKTTTKAKTNAAVYTNNNRRKSNYGPRTATVPFKKRRNGNIGAKDRQRLQRLKRDAFHQLDAQIRREQLEIVRRMQYLDSLPSEEREMLLQAELEIDVEDSDEDIMMGQDRVILIDDVNGEGRDEFDNLLDDICAIDLAEDDYIEVLQFEDGHDGHEIPFSNDAHEIAMAGPGDLF
ncbi:uncharacterized protein EV422DRAFT_503180 [Fimicolochytrium jonesii]|uniref:uncharacterized protein n=1 Tax=Fimicolochytrium jonesii TaxID=1396493 RepID=UPI0022FF2B1F|nr:uncharacterized protein EV422DRAFT_503180 [Fimicolochytrium jonesii]KAI8825812.1 hypothetical protein EV422DRAFT_503180 [Fimicolochytrium jonesii]